MEPIFNDFFQDIIGKLGGLDRHFSVEDLGNLIGQLMVSSHNLTDAMKTLNGLIEFKQDISP